ncbi:MAG TPA: GAF domain-containing protein [Candidatus Tumulicola sp.]|jgi:GAF domain-containing protein
MSVSYDLLQKQAEALSAGESDFVANAANFAAFLYHELPDVNWAGFYLLDESGDLVLGPFAGKPACTRLPRGRGVCGTALSQRETLVIADVAAFADHIVCDSASRSELVVPIFVGGDPIGVFDLDSPVIGRFSSEDRDGIEALVRGFASSGCFAAKGRPTTG